MTDLDRTITIRLNRPAIPEGVSAQVAVLRQHLAICATLTDQAPELDIVADFDMDEVDFDEYEPDLVPLHATDAEIQRWCAEHAVQTLFGDEVLLVRTKAGPDIDVGRDSLMLRGSDEIPWPAWERALRDLVALWRPHDAHVGPHKAIYLTVDWRVYGVWVGRYSYVADDRPLDPALVETTPWADGVLVRAVPGREADAQLYLSRVWAAPPREGKLPDPGQTERLSSDDGLVTVELSRTLGRVVSVEIAPEGEGRPEAVAPAITQVANRVFDALAQHP